MHAQAEQEKPFLLLAKCYESGGSQGGNVERDLRKALRYLELYLELHPAVDYDLRVSDRWRAQLVPGEVACIDDAKRSVVRLRQKLRPSDDESQPLTAQQMRQAAADRRKAMHAVRCQAARMKKLGL